ncbi:hypothetical protein P692DRAFT_20880121 [Suillus brevipes Sb2]|nr:hypothetical protein P692DRAFT_20880121 [Suillus brevipes Sb2]
MFAEVLGRFMGLNDLMSEIKRDPTSLIGDEPTETKVLKQGMRKTRAKASTASSESLSPHPLPAIAPLLSHSRPAVRKRAILTLSQCVPLSPPALANDLLQNHILLFLAPNANIEKQRTTVHLIAAIIRQRDDDEAREGCLQALETLLLKSLTEAALFLSSIVQIGNQFIKYDLIAEERDSEERTVVEETPYALLRSQVPSLSKALLQQLKSPKTPPPMLRHASSFFIPSPYLPLLHRIVFRDAWSRDIFCVASHSVTCSFEVSWRGAPSGCVGSLRIFSALLNATRPVNMVNGWSVCTIKLCRFIEDGS